MNSYIPNILKLDCILEDIKLCQKNWGVHLQQTEGYPKPKVVFQQKRRKRRDMGRPTKRLKEQEHFVV